MFIFVNSGMTQFLIKFCKQNIDFVGKPSCGTKLKFVLFGVHASEDSRSDMGGVMLCTVSGFHDWDSM